MFGSLVQLAAAVWAHVEYNQDGGMGWLQSVGSIKL